MNKNENLKNFLVEKIAKIDDIHKSLLITEIMDNGKLEQSKFLTEAIKKANKRKTFEYIAANAMNKLNFDHWCNKMINAGWKPNGGVSIAFDPNEDQMVYTQAFYREIPL